MAKFIAAVVLTFMLAVPLQAEATCAWVLWSYTPGPDAAHSPIRAHQTKAACDQDETRMAERAEERRQESIKHGAPVMYFSYTCLPDTIDPRGPKGRTR